MLILLDHKVSGVYAPTVNSLLPSAHIIRASLKIMITLFLTFKLTAAYTKAQIPVMK